MRVEVGTEFASMPPRTTVHTSAVNSMTAMWDTFHPIRVICRAGGLLLGGPGHMGHIRALDERRNAIERQDVFLHGADECRPLCRFEHFPHGLGSAE
ncbi:protein of unknown function [Streptomyces murinus]